MGVAIGTVGPISTTSVGTPSNSGGISSLAGTSDAGFFLATNTLMTISPVGCPFRRRPPSPTAVTCGTFNSCLAARRLIAKYSSSRMSTLLERPDDLGEGHTTDVGNERVQTGGISTERRA